MDKMREIAGSGALMPRFNDGMANMAELIRVMTEPLVNEIMDTRADDARESCNRRNGYRERKLATSVGTIALRIPKLRAGSYFPEDLIERFSRMDRAVIAAVSEMAANGVSTRKVKRVAQGVGMGRTSASRVSKMCLSLDESIADRRERDLSDVIHPYPGDAWQRRIAHLMCSAAGNAPTRQKKDAVLGNLKAAFAERDPGLVRAPPARHRPDRGPLPQGGRGLEEAEADALTYLNFPHELGVRLRTKNVRERADRKLKRASRVVQVFPSRKSLIRMMGAVLTEMDEDWAGRRWFSNDPIGRATKGTAAEEAPGIIALAVADNPIPGRKAAWHALE